MCPCEPPLKVNSLLKWSLPGLSFAAVKSAPLLGVEFGSTFGDPKPFGNWWDIVHAHLCHVIVDWSIRQRFGKFWNSSMTSGKRTCCVRWVLGWFIFVRKPQFKNSCAVSHNVCFPINLRAPYRNRNQQRPCPLWKSYWKSWCRAWAAPETSQFIVKEWVSAYRKVWSLCPTHAIALRYSYGGHCGYLFDDPRLSKLLNELIVLPNGLISHLGSQFGYFFLQQPSSNLLLEKSEPLASRHSSMLLTSRQGTHCGREMRNTSLESKAILDCVNSHTYFPSKHFCGNPEISWPLETISMNFCQSLLSNRISYITKCDDV